jgi:hypothetical protein
MIRTKFATCRVLRQHLVNKISLCLLWLSIWAFVAPLTAQWLHYPSAGVPHKPNGDIDYQAPAPRTPDGKPDFSGVWSRDNAPPKGAGKPWGTSGGGELRSVFVDIAWGLEGGVPYQPWAAELANKRKVREGIDGPETHCEPLFLLQRMSSPGVKKFVQSPGVLLMLWERNMEYRQVFTDGRPLPEDPNPSRQGYSSGKWDGDTLVVETIGFKDGLWADGFGSPLTDAAKVTERLRRPTYGQMHVEVTVDDPKAYTRPWTVALRYNIMPDTDLLEQYLCENERDSRHLVLDTGQR